MQAVIARKLQQRGGNHMLLKFVTKNYKSFADKAVFSMTPAPRQTGLDYSVLKAQAGSQVYKGLCAAVIYGPNASGKTNLIGAMDTFKSIVLRGNVRDAEQSGMNAAGAALEMVPNCNEAPAPTEFSISFIDGTLAVEYSLTIDLGPFMAPDYNRKILREELLVNRKQVFLRDDTLTVDLPSVIRPYLNKGMKRKSPKTLEIAKSSLSDTELFLNNGFKTIYAQDLVKKILDWLTNRFIVIYRSDDIRLVRRFSDPKKNSIYVEETLTKAARAFGITSNALGYRVNKESDGEDALLYSIFEDKKLMIPAELFESFGTIRFINESPLVINALVNGGTLIMDEFDASIHPMALMNIINIFHNDEINTRNAQLVFNTQNPIFLDSSLFRRDEIKFVERDENTGRSTHYSLSDFKTSDGIRKGEDYMKNYFVNRYGAIRNIDFSPIIERIMKGDGVNSDD